MLSDLAPSRGDDVSPRSGGCRGFAGPIPPPLLMSLALLVGSIAWGGGDVKVAVMIHFCAIKLCWIARIRG